VQIAGKGTKLANGFLGAVFANGHEVKIGSDINAGSMEIDPFKNVLANFCFWRLVGFFFAIPIWAILLLGCSLFERSASARVGEILEIF
jgi:hypothetical protein